MAKPNDEWELRATRIAVALDIATDELQKLIDDIRKRRDLSDEGNQADARRKS